jgi:hypothetical protein
MKYFNPKKVMHVVINAKSECHSQPSLYETVYKFKRERGIIIDGILFKCKKSNKNIILSFQFLIPN